MRRLVVLMSALLLGLTVMGPAWANQTAFRYTEDVSGLQFVCDDAVYTITSGEVRIVVHEGSAAQGNENFTLTLTPRKVVAEDESGTVVSIVGAFWVGGALNANTGGEVFTVTEKFQLVSRDSGTVGNVNVTIHLTTQPNYFVFKAFDFGNCSTPN